MGNRAFNLNAKKHSHPLDELSELAGGQLRSSDLDGLDAQDVLNFIRPKGKKIKQAKHGDGFSPASSDYNPYQTSGLVNVPTPERWRTLPGGGRNNTNDEGEDKNLKGRSENDDYAPLIQRNNILDKTEGKMAPSFVVRKYPSHGEVATLELAKKLLGPKAECDGVSMFVAVRGRENAMRLSVLINGLCEEKGKRK